jgi:serine/threonine protein kinase
MIVGNISDDELEYGKVLGNGAAGYVYAAVHKPTGRKVAIKSINVFDKGKRHQLINDLRSLANHTCPFLVQFYGAIFQEGFVKVLLEMMDLGSLDKVIEQALKNPDW